MHPQATRRVQQLTSCYLALCVALGGFIAASPLLHVWIEHGGQGPTHFHYKGAKAHSHPLASSRHAAPFRKLLVHQHGGFDLPIAKLLGVMMQPFKSWFATKSSPSEEGPTHEHQSLSQLIASGSIECCFDPPGPAPGLVSSHFDSFRPVIPLPTADWDAQTASRAPPFAVS